MINGVTSFTQSFLQGCENSLFGCKILATAKAYDFNPRFASFWEGNATLGFWDQTLTIAGKITDIEEFTAFLQMLGPEQVFCSYETAVMLQLALGQTGDILVKDLRAQAVSIICPCFFQETKAVFTLLEAQKMVTDYEGFCLDFTHRLRHGTGTTCLIWQGEQLVSCAISVSVTEKSAVLTAVATAPAYTGRGFGRRAVLGCEAALLGRKIYVVKEKNKNELFYQKLGYTHEGYWATGKIQRGNDVSIFSN